MSGRPGSQGTLVRQRLRTSVWVWYLVTGTVLAVTRVALLVWLNHPHTWWHTSAQTEYLLVQWLYPEDVVSILWRSIAGFYGTKYYLAWCSLLTVGSFVMATPILVVSWLRHRRTTPRPSR
jgi:hypothetical protein